MILNEATLPAVIYLEAPLPTQNVGDRQQDDTNLDRQSGSPAVLPTQKGTGKLGNTTCKGGKVGRCLKPPQTRADLDENYICININGRHVETLIDTGASYSVISANFRESLKVVMIKNTNITLKVANNRFVSPLVKCLLRVGINDFQRTAEFLVLPSCSHDVILGWDFLESSSAIMDCGQSEISLLKIQPQEICPIVEANENYVSKGVESTYKMSKLEGSIENLTNIDNAERPVGMENISPCISPELPPSHKIELLELLERFSELFNPITKSPSEHITKHKIATGDARPLKRRPYRVSPSERKVIQEEVDRMMEIGAVQPSKSPWASPVVFDNFSDHLARIEAVLNCFKKVGLRLNPSKCSFGASKIKILGHQPHNNLQQVRSFLGLSSYYRRFIRNYADIARPLNALLSKGTKFEWNTAQEGAFRNLKIALTSKPVLGHFDDDAPTELHTDASGYGIGAVLAQKQGSDEKVIAYASRTLLRAEQNYSTTESRLARWALRLQEYDVSIVYKTGRMHQDADCLSRNPLKHTEENFNDDIPILFLLSDIGREQENDPYIAEIIRNISQPSLTKQDEKFKFVKGILYRKNYDPTGQPLLLVVRRHLRMEILSDLHDAPTAGHLGFAKTYDRVKRRFYWPGLYRSVKRCVGHCQDCQRRKGVPQLPPGYLKPIPPPDSPFQKIVVCTDYLTKYAVTQSLGSGEAQEIAKFLLEEVILKHGAPREIVMDRGRNFQSKLLQELTNKCGIKKKTTTAYHPQTNGLTERLNRTIADMLSMYMDPDQKNWDEMLPFITFAYNTAKQESTGFTPFFLIHGREAETTLDAIFPYSSSSEGEAFIQNLGTRAEEARQIARHHIFKAQETNKTNYDARHTGKIYEPGVLVWIFIPIRRKISDVTYEVEAVSEQGRRQKKRDTVHILRMKPYYDPSRQEDSSSVDNSTSGEEEDNKAVEQLLMGEGDRDTVVVATTGFPGRVTATTMVLQISPRGESSPEPQVTHRARLSDVRVRRVHRSVDRALLATQLLTIGLLPDFVSGLRYSMGAEATVSIEGEIMDPLIEGLNDFSKRLYHEMVKNQLLLDKLDAKMAEVKVRLSQEPIFKKMSKKTVAR
ncbi:hypothetical protein LAZ67_5004196 [Cordylochernes scorpioides]|uniref:RNA-directed DNA polymerase n=1 Tax=Cordylochernes scorpioides TaxID=51811 RepID=A0ABY6KIS7_9ARAC|nr:hypothetical protein LAZ67_5004196 [Cordylochernes scorpioides]